MWFKLYELARINLVINVLDRPLQMCVNLETATSSETTHNMPTDWVPWCASPKRHISEESLQTLQQTAPKNNFIPSDLRARGGVVFRTPIITWLLYTRWVSTAIILWLKSLFFKSLALQRKEKVSFLIYNLDISKDIYHYKSYYPPFAIESK